MRKLLSPLIAALEGRGYVGADGKPTIMFTVDDGK
jgi:hypothetical protein